MPPISGCVICYQEEDRIADCVRSLAFCSEVIVVDSGSTDRTRELAEELGARVIVNAPFPGFAMQRQFSVDRVVRREKGTGSKTANDTCSSGSIIALSWSQSHFHGSLTV